jgi:hypothetical protein
LNIYFVQGLLPDTIYLLQSGKLKADGGRGVTGDVQKVPKGTYTGRESPWSHNPSVTGLGSLSDI